MTTQAGMERSDKLNRRICIVGAGAAGLTAAETLKEKGYRTVTVLERENVAGGKCRSFTHQDRSYELGAVMSTRWCDTLNSLNGKVNAELRYPFRRRDFGFHSPDHGRADITFLSTSRLLLAWQYLRYRLLIRKNRKSLEMTALDNVTEELMMNLADFMAKNRLSVFGRVLAILTTGYGYGYAEEIPAVYRLRSEGTFPLYALLTGRGTYTWKEGVQSLWQSIAAGHDVRFNTTIQRITRGENVVVETEKERLELDSLILSCPLDESLDFLDATAEETSLFSKIRYYDYQSYACFVDNLPRPHGFLPGHCTPAAAGRAVLWYSRYEDSNLRIFYVLGDWETTEAQTIQNIVDDVGKLGGTFRDVHRLAKWRYFPHVGMGDFADGFYDKLESLQGVNHTFLVGELPGGSVVEQTAAYSKQLVERFF